MRKAELVGFEKFVIKEVPDPEPGKGQVVIRVNYCAVCGTDLEPFRVLKEKNIDTRYISGSMNLWAQMTGITMYQLLGHEISGEIAKVGEGVEGWSVGDRVVPRAYGGYADYVIADVKPVGLFSGLYRIPDGVSMEEAALVEPLSVAVAAVRRSEMKLGDRVAIFGAGPIGLLILQCIRAAGAGEVFISEPLKVRREVAKKLGADEVINPREEDPVERIKDLTGGEGVNVAFECSGVGEVLRQAIEAVRVGVPEYRSRGRVMVVGIYPKPAVIYPNWVVLKNVELRGTLAYNPPSAPDDEFKIALTLLKRRMVNLKPLITAKFPLERINDAFREALEGKHIKVLIHP